MIVTNWNSCQPLHNANITSVLTITLNSHITFEWTQKFHLNNNSYKLKIKHYILLIHWYCTFVVNFFVIYSIIFPITIFLWIVKKISHSSKLHECISHFIFLAIADRIWAKGIWMHSNKRLSGLDSFFTSSCLKREEKIVSFERHFKKFSLSFCIANENFSWDHYYTVCAIRVSGANFYHTTFGKESNEDLISIIKGYPCTNH